MLTIYNKRAVVPVEFASIDAPSRDPVAPSSIRAKCFRFIQRSLAPKPPVHKYTDMVLKSFSEYDELQQAIQAKRVHVHVTVVHVINVVH